MQRANDWKAGANAIAIPCNTAHAFVERIQAHLRVPIVNMLTETVKAIVQRYGAGKTVGLQRRPAPSKVRFITRLLAEQAFN
jgi:aspartate/glutamate racemase